MDHSLPLSADVCWLKSEEISPTDGYALVGPLGVVFCRYPGPWQASSIQAAAKDSRQPDPVITGRSSTDRFKLHGGHPYYAAQQPKIDSK